jgi:hypothetical protein
MLKALSHQKQDGHGRPDGTTPPNQKEIHPWT